ncbi:NADPH:quinone reductase [Chitinophaga jiangningensis]|uniref:NADPH:quinone reductase n=1 Tax=Chitinophaga jiangningensis TaxID=1419482 RepID=A0A1M7CG90_9BACT|nr:NADP-dependent oxidoreductase [Chitinophaga jiangningensis]SHL66268.1 NADPH:quinone reductase [Chitinophaga jiangningensis]
MKAVSIHSFGGPEVLQIEEVIQPTPASDEILVQVFASGINPADWVVRQGGNDFLRPFLKLPIILGVDAAGIVAEIGSEVTAFKKGDLVYGTANFPGDGSYAEYCVAKANQFALKPKSLDFIHAAGVPLASLTAWTALFAHGSFKAGQRVLIQGASGGVGSFAVQFAKAKGAYVIGIASTGNLDYLKHLGADQVIDYTSQKFEETVSDIDLVVEASPQRDNTERLKAISVLKLGGTFVSVNIDAPVNEEVKVALAQKQAKGEFPAYQARREWLEEIAALIDKGDVKVSIDKVFPMEEVAAAHRKSETWHVRGKLILEIKKML